MSRNIFTQHQSCDQLKCGTDSIQQLFYKQLDAQTVNVLLAKKCCSHLEGSGSHWIAKGHSRVAPSKGEFTRRQHSSRETDPGSEKWTRRSKPLHQLACCYSASLITKSTVTKRYVARKKQKNGLRPPWSCAWQECVDSVSARHQLWLIIDDHFLSLALHSCGFET